MKDRIKKLRKEKDLTQTQFGEKIGVKGNTITNYETGLRTPTDTVINNICKTFSVNETWLREGIGNIFIEKPKNQIISEFAADLIKEPTSFKTRLFEAMAKLDERDWITIEKIFDELTKSKENEQDVNNS